MQKLFPHGGIVFDNKTKSYWKEFEFMLHQIQQAVEPKISLNKVMNSWEEISKNLAENSRKRKLQVENNILG